MSYLVFTCATLDWTLTVNLERRIKALEIRCFCRLLGISYLDHIINEEVHNKIRQAIGPYEDLLTTMRRRKLTW